MLRSLLLKKCYLKNDKLYVMKKIFIIESLEDEEKAHLLMGLRGSSTESLVASPCQTET